MVERRRRVRILVLITLVAMTAGSGTGLGLSLAGSKTGSGRGTLTGELSVSYGGPFDPIVVSRGQGTVLLHEYGRTIATQSVAKGHRFHFVLPRGSYQIDASVQMPGGPFGCIAMDAMVRSGASISVNVICGNSAG